MSRLVRTIGNLLDRSSRHPGWCILFAGLATFGIRAALLPVHGIPAPHTADEFAYILGSDTFSSGRLSNPVHPLWQSFESVQILSRPTYSSKYQPGQSLFLAFGQKVLGHPFFGVMISAALMSAALCWMLFGWTGRRWALVISLYPVLFFPASNYWMDSYWGGAVVALGAALTLGAFPRLVRRPRAGAAALFALGLSLLFLTRPYEGGALGVTVVLMLAWKARRRVLRARLLRWSVALPAIAIIVATLSFQLRLNRSVTGSALLLPYILHIRTYSVPPLWWAMKGAGPIHPGPAPAVRQQHYEEYFDYQRVHDALPWSAFMICGRVLRLLFLLCYPVVLIPFLLPAIGRVIRHDPWLRALVVCALVCYFSLAMEVWTFAHYLAPLFTVVLALIGRSLWKTYRQSSPKMQLALAVAVVAFVIAAPLARHVYELQKELSGNTGSKFGPSRAEIDRSLTSSGERHLIFVRYLPGHLTDEEWVYNKAAIDNAAVIWARDMGPTQNDRVLAYYGKSRHYWLLEAGHDSIQLRGYDAPTP